MAVEVNSALCLDNMLNKVQNSVIIDLDSLGIKALQDTCRLAEKHKLMSLSDLRSYTAIQTEDIYDLQLSNPAIEQTLTKNITTRYELEQSASAIFNRPELSVSQTELSELQTVKNIRATCVKMHEELQCDDISAAFSSMKTISNLMDSEVLAQAPSHLRSDYSPVLKALKRELEMFAQSLWEQLVYCSEEFLQIDSSDRLLTVVLILEFTDTLVPNIEHFFQTMVSGLFSTVLLKHKSLIVDQDRLSIGTEVGSSALGFFEAGLQFISTRLPGASTLFIRSHLAPLLQDLLRREYIPIYLATFIEGSSQVHVLRTNLINFQQHLNKLGLLPKKEDAALFWDQCVDLWFDRRRDRAMSDTRHAVLSWQGFTKAVQIQVDSSVSSGTQARDARPEPQVSAKTEKEVDENEQEDWGNDDWGMSDVDDVPEEPPRALKSPISGPQDKSDSLVEGNGICVDSYIISSIPDAVVQIAESHRNDINTLKPYMHEDAIRAASMNDRAIEQVLLEIYSMLVRVLVRMRGYPRLLVYNDCVHLANMFPSMQKLKMLGETYYAEEIAEKRQQVNDLMEQCEGFIASTAPSQQVHYYNVIQEVINLLSRLHERYESFLNHNAMFTALGTLAEAAIRYMTDSIMAMTDISEAESIELAKMGDTLSLVEQVFRRPYDPVPLAGMWCTSWFKFRYVLDILEANIDYILELWHENALSDFTPDEIKHLLTALFSDSQKRRLAIEQIESSID